MAAAWTTTRGERVWVWGLVRNNFFFFIFVFVFVLVFVEVVEHSVSQSLFGPSFPIFVHAND
jgi:hypothetical protein